MNKKETAIWEEVREAGRSNRKEEIRTGLLQMTVEERIEIEKELGIKTKNNNV